MRIHWCPAELRRLRAPRRFRSYLVVAIACLTLALSLPSFIGAAFAAGGDVGFEDLDFGGGVDEDENRLTAAKPESKLWYTDGGIWWAILYSTSATSFTIHRLDLATQSWIDTGVYVDERAHSRQDVLLDGDTLYVVSRFGDDPAQNRLLRFTYQPAAQFYELDAGFPVEIPGGGTESLTVAQDSTGELWIAYTLDRWVYVSHTLGSDTAWADPFVVPITDEDPEAPDVAADDIAGIIALDGTIGVFWSNQATKEDYFAVHIDGTSPTDPTAWNLEVAATGGSIADDHFNMKLADDGRLFVAVKTSFSDSSETLIGLLVRQPDGAWSPLHNVGTVAVHPTRPACLLDEVRRQVHVFYSLDKAAIYMKSSSIDVIAFPDPDGPGTPFMESTSTDDINNPTTTKQNVTPSTGLVVAASSPSTNRYWHNLVEPACSAGMPDGAACDDRNACTLVDICVEGRCVGQESVTCPTTDACHDATCDPATGQCVDRPKRCTPFDGCHDVGECNPATGQCTNPVKADGAACDDGNLCTEGDTCVAGVCAPGDPVSCAELDTCYEASVCDSSTGQCSVPQGGAGEPPAPTIVELEAVADAYTDGRDRRSNFGDAAYLEADNRWGRNIYLRFVVEGTENAEIESAIVRMRTTSRNDAKSKAGGDMRTVSDGSWREDTLTHANRPPIDGPLLDSLGAVKKSETVEFDVTAAVAGDGTYDFGIESSNADTVVYASREAPSGRPTLIIRLAAPVEEECPCGEGATNCGVLDQCHDKPDGTPCDDGNQCTLSDTCEGGTCVGDGAVDCGTLDACHEAGTCDPATGQCWYPIRWAGWRFAADADAYTDGGAPAENFGDESTLRVDGSPERRLYIRFPVSGIDGQDVQSAVLRLATTGASNAGGDDGGTVRAVTDLAWDEMAITHENRPPLTGAALSSAGTVEPSSVVELDVTAAISGAGTYSFGLDSLSSNGVFYRSRDAGSGAPELMVSATVACDDGNPCTQRDRCVQGACIGDVVVCGDAPDDCHHDGECNPQTGLCVNAPKADGLACDDGNPCTQLDACVAGRCSPGDPVVCGAPDDCHLAGQCDPQTGLCVSPPRADGSVCDDGNPCTQGDTCAAGSCSPGESIRCEAPDDCHDDGVCDPASGTCVDRLKPDGAACDDGNACSRVDRCLAGHCVGTDPVLCPAPDQCHDAGVCDPGAGHCVAPPREEGTACDDGAFCTVGDACRGGVCVGTARHCGVVSGECREAVCDEAKKECAIRAQADGSACDDGAFCTVADSCISGVCTGTVRHCGEALQQCVEVVCDETNQQCRPRSVADGIACDDGDPCTRSDTCVAGRCAGADPVECGPADACREAGRCDPTTGRCFYPLGADGSPCDDGDPCTTDDRCSAGLCAGEAVVDGDCAPISACPDIPGSDQGGSALCQCTSPAPGRCIVGGGSQRTDCLMELLSTGPITLNRRGTKVRSVLHCEDGDPVCDRDGARDGVCTFGVSLCFGNLDPRLESCKSRSVRSVKIIRPRKLRGAGVGGRNATRLRRALEALGLDVRERSRVITHPGEPLGYNRCSQTIELAVPAPRGKQKKSVRRTFQLRATAVDGSRDKDRFVFHCR